MDRLADAINKIKTNERIGRRECTLYSTKLVKAVLDVLKRSSYIGDYEEFEDGKFKYLKVKLSNRINDIGVVKPRYSIAYGFMQKYEMMYIPSRDFGALIISTPQGVMTNKEAYEKHVGGRLLAYVY
ncbi:MAG: 30S ribosomal protein S8 [Candidatus Micrarchaeaceae archaeon]